ncbi:MAG: flagellar biosynthetic protein FliQ [Paracoccaceae bacterium]
MTEAEILDVLRQALWTAFVVSIPVLGVSLATGLAIGLFQALTSIQEMTLTFVPKLAAILIVFWLSMGFSGQQIVAMFQTAVIPKIAGR